MSQSAHKPALAARWYLLVACCVAGGSGMAGDRDLDAVPRLAEYCVRAQRIITQTDQPVEVVIHATVDGFVKSKAIIPDGTAAVPRIQQLNWTDAGGSVVGVSCKLKSADHLNLVYGARTAGPDGACQDMNRAVYRSVAGSVAAPRFTTVVFDEFETVSNAEEPGMTGPDWLRPYRAMYVGTSGDLHIRAKGFRVDFTDPQFARAPASFRGVHYCHLIPPGHLRAVLAGDAEPDTFIGREVDVSRYAAPGVE